VLTPQQYGCNEGSKDPQGNNRTPGGRALEPATPGANRAWRSRHCEMPCTFSGLCFGHLAGLLHLYRAAIANTLGPSTR
jgi:hypothetical protein